MKETAPGVIKIANPPDAIKIADPATNAIEIADPAPGAIEIAPACQGMAERNARPRKPPGTYVPSMKGKKYVVAMTQIATSLGTSKNAMALGASLRVPYLCRAEEGWYHQGSQGHWLAQAA